MLSMGKLEELSSGAFPDEASKFAFDKKKNAEILASGYTKTKRTIEITSVSIFVILLIISFVRITSSLYFLRNFWVSLCACVLSMCIADFFSGIAHCMFSLPSHNPDLLPHILPSTYYSQNIPHLTVLYSVLSSIYISPHHISPQ